MASPAIVRTAAQLRTQLAAAYPWTLQPLIISAPMRVFTGPELALAVGRAGGLGFIGPGEKPESTLADLEETTALLKTAKNAQLSSTASKSNLLPVGVGFQTWNGDLGVAASALAKYRPCAAWLFAPRDGQKELDKWTAQLRAASPESKIWIQVGTLSEAVEAATSASPPDVLVIQGAEAGGHGRAVDGTSFLTLLPEVADAIRDTPVPLVAAGGVADGRGAAAALGLGAAGVAMGTRFLASTEARIRKGYQSEVLRARDGATSTTRTHLYNHLRGTFGWPEAFSPRTIINQSWKDHLDGVEFDELKKRHDEAVKTGDAAWGPEGRVATYAGANIGLVRTVADGASIIETVRNETKDVIQSLQTL